MKASQVKYLIPVFAIGIAAIVLLGVVDWEYLGGDQNLQGFVFGMILFVLTLVGAGIGLGIGHIYFGLDLVFFEESSRSTSHGWSYHVQSGQYVQTTSTTIKGEYKSIKGNPMAPFFKYRYVYLAILVILVCISCLLAASLML